MRKAAVLAYGVLTYSFFLAAMLYAIGFVGDLIVPKTIDRGGRTSNAVVVDLALVALFGVQHSVMARPAFKKRVPAPVERTTFVLASALALDLLFALWRPIGAVVWNVPLLMPIFWLGWALVIASTFLIDHFDLFGLRQVFAYARGVPYRGLPFKQPRVYGYVRHPLMLSFLIAFWAAPRMTAGHLLFAAGMTVYIVAGVALEERDLVASFGRAYEDYRTRVPMLFPFRLRLGGPRSR